MNRLTHEQVYIDTNIFIAMIEAFNRVALELFRRAEQGEIFPVTSDVTLGELLVKPFMNSDHALAARYRAQFSDGHGLTTIPADQQVMEAAARLSAREGLELMDAVHCATAEIADCAFIVSNDRDLITYSAVEVLPLDALEIDG